MDGLHVENMLKTFAAEDIKCKLYLIHGDMSDNEMIGLYSHPKVKALISLSHGEGFGLPLFEASYTGLPIVTTNWSGQCDFLNVPTKVRKKGAKKKTQTVMKPLFGEVEYSLGPIQKEAVWEGVLQPESMWCYADAASFKNIIQDVFSDYDKYKEMAKKLKTYIQKELEANKQYDAFANAVYPAQEVNEPEVVSFD